MTKENKSTLQIYGGEVITEDHGYGITITMTCASGLTIVVDRNHNAGTELLKVIVDDVEHYRRAILPKSKVPKYQFIRAWCNMMGSYSYYTENQIAQAIDEKAPADAIYQDATDNRWVTVGEIKDPQVREHIELKAATYLEV